MSKKKITTICYNLGCGSDKSDTLVVEVFFKSNKRSEKDSRKQKYSKLQDQLKQQDYSHKHWDIMSKDLLQNTLRTTLVGVKEEEEKRTIYKH